MRLIDADVAIDVVHKWLDDIFCISSTADEVTVFKRLRALPTVDAVAIDALKQKDDAIAALQCALDQANEKLAYVSGEECYHYDCEAGRKQLEAWWAARCAESVRHGRWARLDIPVGEPDFKCTVCNIRVHVPTCMGEPMYEYCPVCGAKMDEGEEDG